MAINPQTELSHAARSLRGIFMQTKKGSVSAWLKDLRSNALEKFLESGFPSRRNEEYKYTDLQALNDETFALPRPTENHRIELSDLSRKDNSSASAVLINGKLEPDYSESERTDGIRIESLEDALTDSFSPVKDYLLSMDFKAANPLSLLNTAFLKNGVVITIEPGTVLSKPIYLDHISLADSSSFSLIQPFNFVLAGEGSHVTLIERFTSQGDAKYLNNSQIHLLLEKDAHLSHLRFLTETMAAYSIGTVFSEVKEGAHYESFSISAGAGLARSDINSRLTEAGARASLFGLYMTRDGQHVDHHTFVDHAFSDTRSEELYKGVMDGKSTGVFNGKIMVRQDAQNVDAKQNNANLLLSKSAKINTKPQLEIFADNVRCGHGATIGRIDDEALFYLRSRGIEEKQARQMMVEAFASEILERLPDGERNRFSIPDLLTGISKDHGAVAHV